MNDPGTDLEESIQYSILLNDLHICMNRKSYFLTDFFHPSFYELIIIRRKIDLLCMILWNRKYHHASTPSLSELGLQRVNLGPKFFKFVEKVSIPTIFKENA